MSLTSFLLSSGKFGGKREKGAIVDEGLDAIFQSAPPPEPAIPKNVEEDVERPIVHEPNDAETDQKKRKHHEANSQKKSKKLKVQNEKSAGDDVERARTPPTTKAKPRQKRQVMGDASVEEATPAQAKNYTRSSTASALQPPDSESSDDSEDEGDTAKLVHESVINAGLPKQPKKGKFKAKFVPQDETPEQRNARTIFVGNVSVDVAKNRSLQKQFKRHILALVPTAKVESMRFRSIAFANPTSKLPSMTDVNEQPNNAGGKGKEKEKEARQHDRERAASWRASKGEDEEDKAKQYLSPKEKKRVAFIKQELHEGVDAVNAYVVFAHSPPTDDPRSPPGLDPHEAATLASERCDGTVFMERTLRADVVGRGSGKSNPLGQMNPKTTIFVGNLDFASKEEDLRVCFEGIVNAEKGSPPERDSEESQEEDEEGEAMKAVGLRKRRTWVTRVRIIRDKDTQLGKGFAYVQFINRECVDEILAMDQTKLKFAKRKLRVQRCKILPGGVKVTARPAKATTTSTAPACKPGHVTVPKGDPSLGEKLAHLPKDKRKEFKAADTDRLARRLAKKKAKLLSEKGIKAHSDRERTRRRPTEKKAITPERKKRRVRSGAAVAKLNTKK